MFALFLVHDSLFSTFGDISLAGDVLTQVVESSEVFRSSAMRVLTASVLCTGAGKARGGFFFFRFWHMLED